VQREKRDSDFERIILPHLGAAYNLARWLTKDADSASDIVQDACLKAFTFFSGFRGDNAKAWLLTIVRNTFFTSIRQKKDYEKELNEDLQGIISNESNPEDLLIEYENIEIIRAALANVPLEFREIIILRELEDFSYKEIADITGIPIGTVMSRLARGRKLLQQILIKCKKTIQ
jgi:RNA polymerase sigma-70 factor (ECF subfamily)